MSIETAEETQVVDELALKIANYNKVRLPRMLGTFCHAPSINLNFEQSGHATACCYNRRFILGTYPKNSVEEIWNGAKAAQLREFMKKGDLSHGCQLCQHQLDAGNYKGMRAYGFDSVLEKSKVPSGAKPMPVVMEFELSNICNLECVMCNGFFSSMIRRNREKLEPMKQFYDDSFVEQLRPFLPSLHQAKFLGGEPFLNPLYFKIWDLIQNVAPAVDVVITTNATIMNDRVRNILSTLKPTITISCDSLDPETYESIRVNAKFEEFYKNLLIFSAAGRFHQKTVALSVCPMVQNWKTLPNILKFANENMACLGFNTVIWPPPNSIKNLPKGEISEIHSYLKEACPESLSQSEHWWVGFNYEMYQGMLSQIELWATDTWKEPFE